MYILKLKKLNLVLFGLFFLINPNLIANFNIEVTIWGKKYTVTNCAENLTIADIRTTLKNLFVTNKLPFCDAPNIPFDAALFDAYKCCYTFNEIAYQNEATSLGDIGITDELSALLIGLSFSPVLSFNVNYEGTTYKIQQIVKEQWNFEQIRAQLLSKLNKQLGKSCDLSRHEFYLTSASGKTQPVTNTHNTSLATYQQNFPAQGPILQTIQNPIKLELPQPQPTTTTQPPATQQTGPQKTGFHVFVKIYDTASKALGIEQQVITLDNVTATDSLADIKSKILLKLQTKNSSITKNDVDNLRLLHVGRLFQENETVGSRNIQSEATLYLIGHTLPGFQLFIKTEKIIPGSSQIITVDTDPSETFAQVMAKIWEKIQAQEPSIKKDAFDTFKLEFTGKDLNVCETIQQNNIANESMLYLIKPEPTTQFTINIRKPDTTTVQINVTSDMTIAQLKQAVQNKVPEFQNYNLFFKDNPITGDNIKIDDQLPLKDGITINLEPKSGHNHPPLPPPGNGQGTVNLGPNKQNLAAWGAGALAVTGAAWLAYKFKLYKLLKYGYKELSDLEITKIARGIMINHKQADLGKIKLDHYAPEDQARIRAKLMELSKASDINPN